MDEFLDDILGYDETSYDVPADPKQQQPEQPQRKPEQRGQAGGQAAKRGHGGEQRVS